MGPNPLRPLYRIDNGQLWIPILLGEGPAQGTVGLATGVLLHLDADRRPVGLEIRGVALGLVRAVRGVVLVKPYPSSESEGIGEDRGLADPGISGRSLGDLDVPPAGPFLIEPDGPIDNATVSDQLPPPVRDNLVVPDPEPILHEAILPHEKAGA